MPVSAGFVAFWLVIPRREYFSHRLKVLCAIRFTVILFRNILLDDHNVYLW